jgi:hypothetical protein
MESEEKEDQEEGGMKEQRPQRRLHICKLNNGQEGIGEFWLRKKVLVLVNWI